MPVNFLNNYVLIRGLVSRCFYVIFKKQGNKFPLKQPYWGAKFKKCQWMAYYNKTNS